MKSRGFMGGLLVGALCVAGLFLSGNSCEGQRTNGMGFKTIVINAPPEKVFAYLGDFINKEKEWNPALVEFSEVDGSGLGMTFNARTKTLGQVFDNNFVVLEWVPNQRIVYMGANDTAEVIESYVLAPHPQGTKLIHALQLSGQLPPGISYDAVKKEALDFSESSLKRIKAAMEK